MGESSIPLSKGYDAKKLQFPCSVSEKLDGVPILMEISCLNGEYYYKGMTRQGNANESINDLIKEVTQYILTWDALEGGATIYILGEVTHPDFPAFKDVSGMVRSAGITEGLVFNAFDAYSVGHDFPWDTRQNLMSNMLPHGNPRIKRIDQVECLTEEEVEHCLSRLDPECEGGIIRAHTALWKPNSRHWDYMKHVVRPTVDIRCVGYVEATSKTGQPLGRVGRLKCDYKGTIIGVGAGKMTHTEATMLWEDGFDPHYGTICEVQYKRDDSYSALREPTFQNWRHEKSEPSYE